MVSNHEGWLVPGIIRHRFRWGGTAAGITLATKGFEETKNEIFFRPHAKIVEERTIQHKPLARVHMTVD